MPNSQKHCWSAS